MRILKVWDYEYPWDVRTEKVCRALTDMGHEVHMVARNRRRDPLTEELAECTVHRMAPWSALGLRLDAASQFPAFFNPRWTGLIRRTARQHAVQGVIVRDLPLAPAAVRVAKRLGVPVILDMAEHYAAMMRDLRDTGTSKFGDALVRNPRAVEAVERWVLERVDHTLVVVEESRNRLLAAGVPPERVSVVGNTPSVSRVEEFTSLKEASSRREASGTSDQRPLRLIYLGVMEEARGVRLVIDAVAAARKQDTPVTLDLIGDGRSLADFTRRARELGLGEDVVRIHGFVEYRKALRMVSEADVGLIPHHASESWESTIPNKLFDYMSLAVPVIASDVTPVARVLEETGAGMTFKDRNVEDLTRVIRDVGADPGRKRMGDRGLEAIRDRYHFERDAQVLEKVVDQVFGRRTKAVTG